jgi:hypothetical protein
MLQQIMQRIGCRMLHLIPVKAEGRMMATLAV